MRFLSRPPAFCHRSTHSHPTMSQPPRDRRYSSNGKSPPVASNHRNSKSTTNPPPLTTIKSRCCPRPKAPNHRWTFRSLRKIWCRPSTISTVWHWQKYASRPLNRNRHVLCRPSWSMTPASTPTITHFHRWHRCTQLLTMPPLPINRKHRAPSPMSVKPHRPTSFRPPPAAAHAPPPRPPTTWICRKNS